MDEVAVKSNSQYTLKIMYDDEVQNPREWENLSKMICFHSRYDIGDKHDFRKPQDFLQSVLFEQYSVAPCYGKPVYDYIKQGHAKAARLEYNRSSREWELLEKNYWTSGNDWNTFSSYPANLKGQDIPDWFLEEALSLLQISELTELVQQIKDIEISPLYLYDHSAQHISMQTFSGRAQHADWDSGQVGWVYVTHEDIAKKYGDTSPANIEKAWRNMEYEVETYDNYLNGDCYGFELFDKKKQLIDSCWGFIGSFDNVKHDIGVQLPQDAKQLAENIKYGDNDKEYDKKPSILSAIKDKGELIKSQDIKTPTAKKDNILL